MLWHISPKFVYVMHVSQVCQYDVSQFTEISHLGDNNMKGRI
jgi:hypothetical protein